ncbi:MAG: hypothetical protein EYC70_07280 [Planctomycetota bacterium]|nr:MAG: hypothetical protein EYC70_07280 [Planctomycetota bacterium]
MRLDFTKVDDVEDLRAVPEGEYPCRVVEVRVSQSPAGHTRWGIRWEVSQGPFIGRTACWDSLHWTERGLPRAKFVLKVLGFDVSEPLEVEASDLEGREALVTCSSEEREDAATGLRRLLNRVPFTGYRPLHNGAAAADPKA